MGQLRKTERQEIQEYLRRGHSIRAIARMLCRSPSTISREIKRNSVQGEYDAGKAVQKAYYRRYWVTKERPKIRGCPALEEFIETSLKGLNAWSPEQIAGRWNKEHAAAVGVRISTPTLYRFLYRHRLDLCKYLCTKRTKRKKRVQKTKRQMIPQRTWIEDRPPIVDEKVRISDWEGDTICSLRGDKTTFLVLHDRASRFIRVSKSCDKKPKRIASKVRSLLKDAPTHTLTLDNGIEFKDHLSYQIPTFFCQPYSSWQKGAVEYSNRLIRRHVPKKSILANVHQKHLASIVHAINNTPRKCLNFQTPAEVFFSSPYLTP